MTHTNQTTSDALFAKAYEMGELLVKLRPNWGLLDGTHPELRPQCMRQVISLAKEHSEDAQEVAELLERNLGPSFHERTFVISCLAVLTSDDLLGVDEQGTSKVCLTELACFTAGNPHLPFDEIIALAAGGGARPFSAQECWEDEEGEIWH